MIWSRYEHKFHDRSSIQLWKHGNNLEKYILTISCNIHFDHRYRSKDKDNQSF